MRDAHQHHERAIALMRADRYSDAEKELYKALTIDPNDGRALELLAACKCDCDSYADGLKLAEKALSQAPDSPSAYYLIALAHRHLGNLSEAETAINEAIRLSPERPAYYAELAHILGRGNEFARALEASEAALKLDPQDLEARNIHAVLLRRVSRTGESIERFHEVLRDAPENEGVHCNMAVACLQAGRLDDAETHYREALRINPNNDQARVGALRTIKARIPIYRWILNYRYWSQSKSPRVQGIIYSAILVIYYFALRVQYSEPSLTAYTLPVLFFSGCYLLADLLIDPLANAAILVHPFGRLALSRQERREALVVSLVFLAALSLLVTYYATPNKEFVLAIALATGCVGLLLITGARLKDRYVARYVYGAAFLLGIAAAAVLAIDLAFAAGGSIPAVLHRIQRLPIGVLLATITTVTFLSALLWASHRANNRNP